MDSELKILYKVRKTAIITLRDRGYDIPAGADKMTIDDFKILWEKSRHHLYFPDMVPPDVSEDEKLGGGVLVYFESSDDFTKKLLESRVSQLFKEYPNLDRLYFILKTYGIPIKKLKINNFVVTALTTYPTVRVLENIYPFDFMKNKLVPECNLLTEKEKKAVITLYGTPLDKFPKLEVSDPLSKRFGAKIGDMLYIKRYGGAEISYRTVVKTGSS